MRDYNPRQRSKYEGLILLIIAIGIAFFVSIAYDLFMKFVEIWNRKPLGY